MLFMKVGLSLEAGKREHHGKTHGTDELSELVRGHLVSYTQPT